MEKQTFTFNYSEVGNIITCPNCGLKHSFDKAKEKNIGMTISFICAADFVLNVGCGSVFHINIDKI